MRIDGTPFCVKNFMRCARFNKIITGLTYTEKLTPLFVDKFWEAIKMIRSCKDHMKENFVPSWVNFLEDRM